MIKHMQAMRSNYVDANTACTGTNEQDKGKDIRRFVLLQIREVLINYKVIISNISSSSCQCEAPGHGFVVVVCSCSQTFLSVSTAEVIITIMTAKSN